MEYLSSFELKVDITRYRKWFNDSKILYCFSSLPDDRRRDPGNEVASDARFRVRSITVNKIGWFG
jgi:hypothetical protein